eukprot:CAMPEP_0172441056 /NCGR_PEP_ID=MMETSP1065-20121228/1633_1 /TAXON_ID=265537 /ORGANISM="Amphiprora paludosa, Strain CCMP125" /LENGTH=53 /DNA_ID=CAMNT_0013190213 /DNA_START=31 /DNA_END=189 /DNA_ORIENTATION=+
MAVSKTRFKHARELEYENIFLVAKKARSLTHEVKREEGEGAVRGQYEEEEVVA